MAAPPALVCSVCETHEVSSRHTMDIACFREFTTDTAAQFWACLQPEFIASLNIVAGEVDKRQPTICDSCYKFYKNVQEKLLKEKKKFPDLFSQCKCGLIDLATTTAFCTGCRSRFFKCLRVLRAAPKPEMHQLEGTPDSVSISSALTVHGAVFGVERKVPSRGRGQHDGKVHLERCLLCLKEKKTSSGDHWSTCKNCTRKWSEKCVTNYEEQRMPAEGLLKQCGITQGMCEVGATGDKYYCRRCLLQRKLFLLTLNEEEKQEIIRRVNEDGYAATCEHIKRTVADLVGQKDGEFFRRCVATLDEEYARANVDHQLEFTEWLIHSLFDVDHLLDNNSLIEELETLVKNWNPLGSMHVMLPQHSDRLDVFNGWLFWAFDALFSPVAVSALLALPMDARQISAAQNRWLHEHDVLRAEFQRVLVENVLPMMDRVQQSPELIRSNVNQMNMFALSVYTIEDVLFSGQIGGGSGYVGAAGVELDPQTRNRHLALIGRVAYQNVASNAAQYKQIQLSWATIGAVSTKTSEK